MVAPDSEVTWIEQSREGDHEAFGALIRQYQHMIHALTYRMTGSMTDAEDLAQEAFIQAYRQINHFRAEARFSSWLYRIAVNACLNWRKQRVRRDRLHQEWGFQESAAPEHDQHISRVQDALMKLCPKQRAAMILTVYENMTHAEAALILGCSETTVSWRIFVARKQLKKLLSPNRPKEPVPVGEEAGAE